ncbi:hypothetical protein [Bradyrhizobium sp. NC92]|uniref:hypothetical protein n=1 Tax=Bradyrhizobium sp. (strain NC92) TaxID=55395 RepID=UPI0021AAF560|nr:hypothetical protein [Bradyrhizobium sp. NC92]UWU66228.1 hypothetical protein N2602_23605 [Bradyrhizobium sp. NC92]
MTDAVALTELTIRDIRVLVEQGAHSARRCLGSVQHLSRLYALMVLGGRQASQ